MAKRSPFPLQWPPGYPRAKLTKHSKFGAVGTGSSFSRTPPTPYEAAKQVLAELRRLGASHATITTNLPTRNDGLPYADGRTDDSGVAVWCVLGGVERVFPCDTWRTVGENLRAIQLSLDAMRGLARWGMADVAQRAFAGYAALPPGSGNGHAAAPVKRSWREVFEYTASSFAELDRADQLALVKMRHRDRIRSAHPDAGGSHELATELNAALAEAEKELVT